MWLDIPRTGVVKTPEQDVVTNRVEFVRVYVTLERVVWRGPSVAERTARAAFVVLDLGVCTV